MNSTYMDKLNIADYDFLFHDYAIKSKVDNKVYIGNKQIFDKIAKSIGFKNADTLEALYDYDKNFSISDLQFPLDFYIIDNTPVYISAHCAENMDYLKTLYYYPTNCFIIDLLKEKLIHTIRINEFDSITSKTVLSLDIPLYEFKLHIKALVQNDYEIPNLKDYLNSKIPNDLLLEIFLKCKVVKHHKGTPTLRINSQNVIYPMAVLSGFSIFDFVDNINFYHEHPYQVTVGDVVKLLRYSYSCHDIDINKLVDIYEKIHECLNWQYAPQIVPF